MVPYANDLRSPGFASMNTQADKGRAFFWAFDTLSVGIRTSVDGKTRQVVSDGYFMGSPSGREARFVEVRVKLMPPLAFSTWLKCEGECESSKSSLCRVNAW